MAEETVTKRLIDQVEAMALRLADLEQQTGALRIVMQALLDSRAGGIEAELDRIYAQCMAEAEKPGEVRG